MDLRLYLFGIQKTHSANTESLCDFNAVFGFLHLRRSQRYKQSPCRLVFAIDMIRCEKRGHFLNVLFSDRGEHACLIKTEVSYGKLVRMIDGLTEDPGIAPAAAITNGTLFQ